MFCQAGLITVCVKSGSNLRMAKRIFDVLCALLGVIFLSPIFILIAFLIKLDSRGPVFYRGIRTGIDGLFFRIFKFRTMVPDAERQGGFSTAKDDQRVTRVGKFLRRRKLDELPQLINVLNGAMSIVGPRPEVPAYTRLYRGEEELILKVRPGITDFSSIEFIQLGELLGNDDPDQVYEQKVRPIKNALRVKYVKERNFWLDLSIIFKTLGRLAGIKYK